MLTGMVWCFKIKTFLSILEVSGTFAKRRKYPDALLVAPALDLIDKAAKFGGIPVPFGPPKTNHQDIFFILQFKDMEAIYNFRDSMGGLIVPHLL